jgi:hypothetical protein
VRRVVEKYARSIRNGKVLRPAAHTNRGKAAKIYARVMLGGLRYFFPCATPVKNS